MRFHGRGTGMEIVPLPEYFMLPLLSRRLPVALPDNISPFIREGPAEIAMIEQHMRSGGIAPVGHLVTDADDRLAEYAGDGPLPFETRTEYLRLPHPSRDAHFHPAGGGIGLQDRYDLGRQVAGRSVKAALSVCIRFRTAGMGKAAGGQQPAT